MTYGPSLHESGFFCRDGIPGIMIQQCLRDIPYELIIKAELKTQAEAAVTVAVDRSAVETNGHSTAEGFDEPATTAKNTVRTSGAFILRIIRWTL